MANPADRATDVDAVLRMARSPDGGDGNSVRPSRPGRHRAVQQRSGVTGVSRAASPVQAAYLGPLRDSDISAPLGPAGRQDRISPSRVAVAMLAKGHRRSIVLSRPAVEAGERLRFPPGRSAREDRPHLRPASDDALYDMPPAEQVMKRLSTWRDRGRAARLHARPHAVEQLRDRG